MNKEELLNIIKQQWQHHFLPLEEVERQRLPDIAALVGLPHAIIISGIRRGGKSIFLRQIEQRYYPAGDYYYLTFEDERLLDFYAQDFNRLHEAFIELYGEQKVFFLDEIQNVPKWELFVRRLISEGYKFFITGSNAAMLSQELGTRLTGRHITLELMPYSFCEYLQFKKFSIVKNVLLVTEKKAEIKKHFNQYLLYGGMPQYLDYNNSEILLQTYEDILHRDIISRYHIKEVTAFRRLALYLFNNFASRITFNSLRALTGIAHTSTISTYVGYMENSYLIFTVKQFSFSLKQQHLLPKKLYVIDNGIAQVIALKFSENKGRYLENIVFLELKRYYKEFYYYQTQSGKEVDFVIFNKGKADSLIQVCYTLEQQKTKQRELDALIEAMEELNIKTALILTDDNSEEVEIDDKKIIVKPVYQWLLGLRFLQKEFIKDQSVHFKADSGSRIIPCKISFEALEDHFNNDETDKLKIFNQYKAIIHEKAIQKHRLGKYESDGAIFIKTIEDF